MITDTPSTATERAIRNVRLRGHRTSLRLELAFWDAIDICAADLGMTIHQVITKADDLYGPSAGSLSSAVRLFVIEHFRKKVEDSPMIRRPAALVPSRFRMAVNAVQAEQIGSLVQGLAEAVGQATQEGVDPDDDPAVQLIAARIAELTAGPPFSRGDAMKACLDRLAQAGTD
jgi:predicted DNA-binding ribbon-helix-helix protein